MPGFNGEFRYRSEVDGLRGIAVIAVMLFHAELGLPGGYVGVDVFFVISGFLITSLIVKDIEGGTFGLWHFWERRARRILPALTTVVLPVLVAGWFLLLPEDYADLGKCAAFQAVFMANVFFWQNTGYFAGAAEEKPLLHTWSLAAEEQFYLFVPFILLGLSKCKRLWAPKTVQTCFVAGILLSLTLSCVALPHYRSGTFYLLPTRAWELLIGALIAVLPAWPFGRNVRLLELGSWFGLLGILIPCFTYSRTTPFPGVAAVPPCLGTALIILGAGTGKNGLDKGLLVRWLSSSPMTGIGLISYSLYLWHWPLLAYGRYFFPHTMSVGCRVVLLGSSIILAALSWRFVETPFRRKRLCASGRAMFAFGSFGLVAVLIIGLTIHLGEGMRLRVSPEALRHETAKRDMSFIHDLTSAEAQAEYFVRFGASDPAPVLVVWGDSHAMAAMPAFDEVVKEQGLAGVQATTSAVAPVLGARWHTVSGMREAIVFNEAVFAFVKAHKIRHVVLVASWRSYRDDNGPVPLETALLATIRRLLEAGAQPWIMLQVPKPRFNVPRELARKSLVQRDLTPLYEKPGKWNGLRGQDAFILGRLEAAGARILDPRPAFLDRSGHHYVVELGGVTLYRDDHHLTTAGAKRVLSPFLRKSFIPFVVDPARKQPGSSGDRSKQG